MQITIALGKTGAAMTIVIDPAVRIIADDAQIFVLHPGRGKRFLQDFAEEKAVFLDLPGVAFVAPPLAKAKDVQRLLRMSREIRTWRNAGGKGDGPSRDPVKYKTGGDRARFLHEVEDLYADAKAGDLIIAPGHGYGRTLLIGEFANNFDANLVVYPAREKGEKFPARKVHWLDIQASKRDFSGRLIKLFQNRQAIIRITNPDDRHEVYERTYGDYVWKETSGNLVRVTAEESDLHDLAKAFDLTNYFAAQYLALRKGELQQFVALPMEDALEKYYDKSYFSGVGIEIHSPGFLSRVAKSAAMSSYISVMLALSAQGVSAQDAASAIVSNSANKVVSICDVQLQSDIRDTMVVHANMGLWFSKICPKSQAASESVGLKSDVGVKDVPAHEAPPDAANAGDAEAVQ